MTAITTIAFDGDDTLWHNESLFTLTQANFRALLADYLDGPSVEERLTATEQRNLEVFGYGIKGFTLSMIETAIEVSEGRVEAGIIAAIIEYGKSMLTHPVDLLDGVSQTLEALHGHYRLMVITKGDLLDQEGKIARSGLDELFWKVVIVSEKEESTYRRILTENDIDPAEFLMVGNSIRSDILPVVTLGARAVHVPYHTTWIHEQAELSPDLNGRVQALDRIDALPGVLSALGTSG